MTDCATLLRDHVTLKCRSIDRIFWQAYVPQLQSVGQVCIFLRGQRKFKIPSSAAFGKMGEVYVKAIHPFAQRHQIPDGAVREGTGQGGGSSPLSGSGSPRRSRPGRADRDRPGESFGVALVATEGAEESRPSPHGWGPPDGLHPSFLFLGVGWGMGSRLLEDQRLGSLSHLALAQRPRVGQAAVGEGWNQLRGAGQRAPWLCRPHGVAKDL